MTEMEWIVFCPQVAVVIFAGWLYIKRARKVRAEQETERKFAHCLCGARLSEWFLSETNGTMCHPLAVRGCGWVSPWATHEEYLEWIAVHAEAVSNES